MTTVRKVIKQSLRRLNAVSANSEPTAEDIDVCLEALNGLIDSMSTDLLNIFSVKPRRFLFTPGKQTYTLGPAQVNGVETGADWVVERPMRIEKAVVMVYPTVSTTGGGGAVEPVTTVLDTFEGTGSLADHVGEVGATWSGGYAPWGGAQPDIAIVSDGEMYAPYRDGADTGFSLFTSGVTTGEAATVTLTYAPAPEFSGIPVVEIDLTLDPDNIGDTLYVAAEFGETGGSIRDVFVSFGISLNGQSYDSDVIVVPGVVAEQEHILQVVLTNSGQTVEVLFDGATLGTFEHGLGEFVGWRTGISSYNRESNEYEGTHFRTLNVTVGGTPAPPTPTETVIGADTSTIFYQLMLANYSQFSGLTVRAISNSWPTEMYDDGQYPLRSLSFWPIPQNAYACELWLWSPLATYETIDDELNLPPGYERYLVLKLAIEIAPVFGKTVTDTLNATALEAESAIKVLNQPVTKTQLSDAATHIGGRSPSWTTGNDAPFNMPKQR